VKKVAIAIISFMMLSLQAPALAQEKNLNFQSNHVRWAVKVSGEGNIPFLTNTNYYVSVSGIAKSLPVFKPRDPSHPLCQFKPIDIYDKTDGGSGDYVFGTSLSFTLEVNGRPIQITDPETTGGKNIVMNLDIDESGKVVAPLDNKNYFSPSNSVVERDPIVVVFPFAGEYTLRYKAITFQNQDAIFTGGCRQASSPQDIEVTNGIVNFGTVISKSAYEENKKIVTPSPKRKAKNTQITCIKGKNKLVVSGVKPICPSGYKKVS
jgi:hypothetical protein